MNKKVVCIFICTLLIISMALSVTGKINEKTNPALNFKEDGLELECKRYEEKCHIFLGIASGRWVYKYTVKNTGDSDIEFDGLKIFLAGFGKSV